MARFDWLRFLQRYRIEYVERGANVAKGNVAIRCPWCGQADTSQHLGISLKGSGWGCWRSKLHRGIKPTRLIQALLRCSWEEAKRIAGDDSDVLLTSDEAFAKEVVSLVSEQKAADVERPPLEYPSTIKKLRDTGMGSRFYNYMIDKRDYTPDDIDDLARLYDLRYAVTGAFAYRLIVPVYMDGLVNWTGRSISPRSVVRYRTLSVDPVKAEEAGMPVAAVAIENCLLNYDELIREDHGRSLVVCEGPLDALRVDYFGREEGIRGTCVFGTGNLSDAQVRLLESVNERFPKRLLVLDEDAAMGVLEKQSRLSYLGYRARKLPSDVEDPAVLRRDQVCDLFY